MPFLILRSEWGIRSDPARLSLASFSATGANVVLLRLIHVDPLLPSP